MEAEIKVEVDIQDVWNELDAKQKMEFLKENLDETASIDEIVHGCFMDSDVREFVNKNLVYADEQELIDELIYRGFIVEKE